MTAAIVAYSTCLFSAPARAQAGGATAKSDTCWGRGLRRLPVNSGGTLEDFAPRVSDGEATPETVLGDFPAFSVENFGVVSTFSHAGDKFMVRTDGPDGALHYEITHTFSIDPLQQYLIGFPDGRYQMLRLAWDTRPKDKGGQRWFHLYPGEKLEPQSLLHWTGRDQT